jgi:signal recognition particle GTPase
MGEASEFTPQKPNLCFMVVGVNGVGKTTIGKLAYQFKKKQVIK